MIFKGLENIMLLVYITYLMRHLLMANYRFSSASFFIN